jgi:hypothetical protein
MDTVDRVYDSQHNQNSMHRLAVVASEFSMSTIRMELLQYYLVQMMELKSNVINNQNVLVTDQIQAFSSMPIRVTIDSDRNRL